MQDQNQIQKCTNMDFLKELTKGDPPMMIEIIEVYLLENPRVISKIREALDKGDMESVARGAHMMITSLLTVGIPQEYRVMLKQIEEFAKRNENPEKIKEYFLKIEKICAQSYEELKVEINALNNR